MELVWIIGVTVAVLGFVFGYNYLRGKGVVNDNTLYLVDDFLLMLKIVLEKSGNSNIVRVNKAIEIVRNTIDFISEQEGMSTEEKKDAAQSSIIESLQSIDLEIDASTELLVKLIVNNAFK